ncbi:MAG: rhomboid family intramembrane serine protease [Bacteroidota bacterium]
MITLIIIIITALVTVAAFNDAGIFARLQLNPFQVYHRKEWYRLVTHGFIHVDWGHLIFNMLTLYFFGDAVEAMLGNPLYYILFYLAAIGISSLTTLFKHKDNYNYNSVGASGGVAAVIFASILLNPQIKIMIMFIPIPISGFIFGILYLIYSQYMSRRNADNINHDAHFLGAVFGFTFPILLNVDYFNEFINQIFR